MSKKSPEVRINMISLWLAGGAELSHKNKLPVMFFMMWNIYEILHIWTAVVNKSEEWSSR